jgi:hypothetical protein
MRVLELITFEVVTLLSFEKKEKKRKVLLE